MSSSERSIPMSLLQLFLVAFIAMTGLAVARSARDRVGRTPFPEGNGRRLLIVAFLVVPPIALSQLLYPGAGAMSAVASVPSYVFALVIIAMVMSVIVMIVGFALPRRSHRNLRIALMGNEGNVDDLARDPRMTEQLAENVALVDRTNAVFPRGPDFAAQVDRPGFRAAWEALAAATVTLEGHIADDHRRRQPVADEALSTAADARSRLNTLRRLAATRGQAWAAA